jgi:hypothetical protein
VVQQNTTPKTLYAYQAEKQKDNSASSATTGQSESGRQATKISDITQNGKTQDLLEKFSLQFERPLKISIPQKWLSLRTPVLHLLPVIHGPLIVQGNKLNT